MSSVKRKNQMWCECHNGKALGLFTINECENMLWSLSGFFPVFFAFASVFVWRDQPKKGHLMPIHIERKMKILWCLSLILFACSLIFFAFASAFVQRKWALSLRAHLYWQRRAKAILHDQIHLVFDASNLGQHQHRRSRFQGQGHIKITGSRDILSSRHLGQ